MSTVACGNACGALIRRRKARPGHRVTGLCWVCYWRERSSPMSTQALAIVMRRFAEMCMAIATAAEDLRTAEHAVRNSKRIARVNLEMWVGDAMRFPEEQRPRGGFQFRARTIEVFVRLGRVVISGRSGIVLDAPMQRGHIVGNKPEEYLSP